MDCVLTLGGIDDEVVALVAIAGGCTVALFAICFGTITTVIKSKHREESRREIAAYVAEGSIAPEDAERLLRQDVAGDKA